jgi:2-polyprenyl-3-methyl-5-hydroxy-6-metoxy-1,4-benzoquinol methylase
MSCRHCRKSLKHIFLDLGYAPPSNAYRTVNDLKKPEIYYPLKIYVCDFCWLVQTEDCTSAENLFTSDYSYFSSTSLDFLNHAKNYSNKVINELDLNKDSFVIEIASNDGYLLKNFVKANIPCLGIEPTDSTANFAEKLGIKILRKFFTEKLSRKLSKKKKADLVIGNNVYAHVPDINDFTKGLKKILKDGGTITLEFPHLMRMLRDCQFDTIYHEHFSYLSLHTVCKIFQANGLRVFNVEELPTHGGSLRVYGCHDEDLKKTTNKVKKLLKIEISRGMQKLETYLNFQKRVNKIKNNLLNFLITQKIKKKRVVAYGAAAKGNTLLNYSGIKTDLIPYVCDAAVSKQGKYMPGSHIPIFSPDKLREEKADYILILPWNIASEIIEKNLKLEKNNSKFMIAVPDIKIL